MPSDLERLAADYERSEAAFIRAVTTGAQRDRLADLADATAASAKELVTAAHRDHLAGETAWKPLSELSEAFEQLASLWSDLANAYAARPVRSENPFLRQG